MKKKFLLLGMSVMIMASCIGCAGQTLSEYQAENAQVDSDQNAASADVEGESGEISKDEDEATDSDSATSADGSEQTNGAKADDVEADSVTSDAIAEAEAEAESSNVGAEVATGKAQTIDVYYSNTDADGFEKMQVQIDDLMPQQILLELTKVNVVTFDTKAQSFKKDGNSLILDLSPEFSGYINMMGTSGEYVVTGSLVNTFLKAYGANDILITIDGKTFETSHAVYDKPLTMYEAVQKQETQVVQKVKKPMAYKIKDTSYFQDVKEAYYPQFDGMSNAKLQTDWNRAIADIALNNRNGQDKTNYESYSVDYEICYSSEELVSFKFTKKTKVSGKNLTRIFSLTFDMVEGKCVRLGDMAESMEAVSYNMANHGYYKIITKGVDREAYDEYYDHLFYTAADYRESFLHYDFNTEDLLETTKGYTYVSADGELVLIMNVPEATFGTRQIEVSTGIMVK